MIVGPTSHDLSSSKLRKKTNTPSKADLQRVFHLPCQEAAKKLNISVAKLYNTLKIYGIKGWPTKKQKSKKTVFYNYVVNNNNELIQTKGETMAYINHNVMQNPIPSMGLMNQTTCNNACDIITDERKYSSASDETVQTPSSPMHAAILQSYGKGNIGTYPRMQHAQTYCVPQPVQTKVVLPSFSELLASIDSYNAQKTC